MTMEYAAAGSARYVSQAIDRAPPHIRRSINAARIARGLRPVLGANEYAALDQAAATARAAAEAAEGRRVGVWINGPDGRLVPATAGAKPARSRTTWPSSSTSRPASRHGCRGPLLMARVLIVPCGGIAPASKIRGQLLDEVISPIAFGTADQLNARGGFDLRNGHEGPRFATAGERLRFVDGGSIGPVLVWEPNLAMPWDAEAVRHIEAGHDQASVCMFNMQRRIVDVPERHEMVSAAELDHVGLLLDSGKTGAYPGARAMVFRSVWANDAAELKAQIEKVVARSRWHSWRARYPQAV